MSSSVDKAVTGLVGLGGLVSTALFTVAGGVHATDGGNPAGFYVAASCVLVATVLLGTYYWLLAPAFGTLTARRNRRLAMNDRIRAEAQEIRSRTAGGSQRASEPQPNLEIRSAKYGVDDRWVDVTEIVEAAVAGGRLSLAVSNEVFGSDPCPDRLKRLQIVFRVDGSDTQGTSFDEGERVELP